MLLVFMTRETECPCSQFYTHFPSIFVIRSWLKKKKKTKNDIQTVPVKLSFLALVHRLPEARDEGPVELLLPLREDLEDRDTGALKRKTLVGDIIR